MKAFLEIVCFLIGFAIGLVWNTVRFLYFLLFRWQIGNKK
jgi:hypothetical protein